MVKEFTIPWLGKPSGGGVYKMTFDGALFYIGGTKCLSRRMYKWKNDLCSSVFKNVQVKEAFEKASHIKLEVIETVENLTLLDERETAHITSFWGNPLLLNRSPSASTNKGLKWTDQQINLIRERTGQPVAKFDKEGALIATYTCIKEAIDENKLSRREILRVFRYNGRSSKGFIYKRLDENGIPIEPPASIKKPRAKGFKMSDQAKSNMKAAQQKRLRENGVLYPTHTKPMIKFNENGVELDRYPSFTHLAKSLNVDKKNLRDLLKTGRPGYYKGFFYRPA
jgi:hypothetical protein